MSNRKKLASSFRDPSGFLFISDGVIYRQVNGIYKDNYDHLLDSGLYKALVDAGLLIPHEEVDVAHTGLDNGYKTIKPEPVSFISYPYEWCFSQLKAAALTTLDIQKRALGFGMSLKDSSAYNIQFVAGKPVLIDTLSFERYQEGQPWIAYRQYCQHFLAPLALMCYSDIRLNQLLRIYVDGVPIDLASSLLPFRTRLKFSLLSHIHLHAKSQKHFVDKTIDTNRYTMSRFSLLSLIDSLESATGKLKWHAGDTEWSDYYADTNYSSDAFEHKKKIVSEFLDNVSPDSVWDLGANEGVFSRIASNKGVMTVSFDMDSGAVERNYLECVRLGEINILPLELDLTNPSPSIGWQNRERMSTIQRGPVDTVMALALIHHLAISNNLPFDRIAEFFNRICKDSLIVEFVPKRDSQVQRLLSTREDIFPDYTQPMFESHFGSFFDIEESISIRHSDRIMYLMKVKGE